MLGTESLTLHLLSAPGAMSAKTMTPVLADSLFGDIAPGALRNV